LAGPPHISGGGQTEERCHAEIAKKVYRDQLTLKEAALALGYVGDEGF